MTKKYYCEVNLVGVLVPPPCRSEREECNTFGVKSLRMAENETTSYSAACKVKQFWDEVRLDPISIHAMQMHDRYAFIIRFNNRYACNNGQHLCIAVESTSLECYSTIVTCVNDAMQDNITIILTSYTSYTVYVLHAWLV